MNARSLGSFALVLGLSVWSAAPVCAAQTDPLSTVKQFVESFNKGDAKTALAACASQTNIIDEFPPHTWTSCAAWAAALEAASKAADDTDETVTIGAPWHVDVTGDVAYVVVPTTYAYKEKGKAMSEMASVMTLVLKKSGAKWYITAWTWAKSK